MTPQLIYMPLFSSFLPISVLAQQHYYLPRTVTEPEKEPLLLLQQSLDYYLARGSITYEQDDQ